MSKVPARTMSAILSGEVRRPTPTMGLAVTERTFPVHASW